MSGKSTVARQLAIKLGGVVYSHLHLMHRNDGLQRRGLAQIFQLFGG